MQVQKRKEVTTNKEMFQHRIIKGFETLSYKILQRGSFYTYFVIPLLKFSKMVYIFNCSFYKQFTVLCVLLTIG